MEKLHLKVYEYANKQLPDEQKYQFVSRSPFHSILSIFSPNPTIRLFVGFLQLDLMGRGSGGDTSSLSFKLSRSIYRSLGYEREREREAGRQEKGQRERDTSSLSFKLSRSIYISLG